MTASKNKTSSLVNMFSQSFNALVFLPNGKSEFFCLINPFIIQNTFFVYPFLAENTRDCIHNYSERFSVFFDPDNYLERF